MKYLLVAGGSTGIGEAVLERSWATPGWLSWPLSRSEETLCDLSDFRDAARVAKMVALTWPCVDALVICAGDQAALGRIENCDAVKWGDAIDANLLTAFNAIRAFYPLLKKAEHPKVVCLSGGGASQGRPYFSSYACAKTAVVRLVETLAMEEPNWDVNAVAPGAINTRMLDNLLIAGPKVIGQHEYDASIKQKAEGGDDLNKAIDLIQWLISRESDGITGRLISAKWDEWREPYMREKLRTTEYGKLRRSM